MSESPDKQPGKDTVYIDVDDDITTIIDKVDAAKQKVVALVLPKRANALHSIVNMRLLARSASKVGKNVVLITSESAVTPLAGAAGLHVAKTLQSKPAVPLTPKMAEPDAPIPPVPAGADEDEIDDKSATLDYHRSIGELAATHAEGDVITLDDEDTDKVPTPKLSKSSAPSQAKSQKIKVPNFERFRLMVIGGIAAFLALIIFIFLAVFILPKATVTIQTASIPVSANLTLNASDKYTTLNENQAQIPASLKATKQTSTQQINATGQQNNGEKATGSVTFSEKVCGTVSAPVDVPAGTGVNSNGLTFSTQNNTHFSSSGTVSGSCITYPSTGSTNIKAQSGGTKYNLSAGSSFTVQGYPAVTGTNSSAISGGTDNNTTVVSQTDLDNAKAKITSASSDEFTKKFEKQLSDQGLYVLTSTLKIGDPVVTSTPDVGQPATTANVTVTITYTALTVTKADLRKVISDTLNEQIDKTRQKVSNADVLTGAIVSIQSQTSDATAVLNVTEDTTAVPIIDINQVKNVSVGKKKADIQGVISEWAGVKSVDVKLSPFWVSKAPKKPAKIIVKLQQVKS